ncbi:MAG: acyl-ACP--UDP-N-acetylglucosamine O-acyltransferase [Chitinispirillales bacterium]|jgi:UDP-N-acetylglucosamine acyltransferase|nr:acyl-ACP--UDP-N-acetylglucosamine O-acyltransferase [Chitinispirillales bacterium]
MSEDNGGKKCPCRGSGANNSSGIHPTAVIEPGTLIGSDVTIGPYTVIESDVEIDDGAVIGPHVVLGEGTRIGKRCRIFKGAAIGLEPQDKKYAGEKTHTFIGEGTVLREFVTVNRGTAASGATKIGVNGWIMAYCHIAHDCVLGDGVTISNALAMAGHVTVGNFVTIGGMVAVHQFVRIGDYAMVGALAKLVSDIVPYALTGTDPLRVAGFNKVGLERRGFSADQITNIKRAYKILFREDLQLKDAISKLETEYPDSAEVKNIVDFVKGSERSILRMES